MIRKIIELTARIILALIRHEEGLLSVSSVRARTNKMPLRASSKSVIALCADCHTSFGPNGSNTNSIRALVNSRF